MLEADIANLFFHPNILLDVEDFKESLATYHYFADGKRIKILVEFGEYTNVTTDGRKFSQENNPKGLAEAIVIKNLAQRILTKFYILFHRYNHPMKIFNDKDMALIWLKSI